MTPAPHPLLGRMLAADAVPPDDPASGRILDAARDIVAAGGLDALTMDAVARRAQVGRMTVYRRFGDRERLIAALARREAEHCLAVMAAAAPSDAPLADQIVAGFATAITLTREHPLLRRLARDEPEAVLAALRPDGGALFALAHAFATARMHAAPDVGDLDVEQAAELLVRLALSFALLPVTTLPAGEEALREAAQRLVAPAVSQTSTS